MSILPMVRPPRWLFLFLKKFKDLLMQEKYLDYKTQKTIKIPALSLVLLVGTSGSGKSTFAARHFNQWETVSSDRCRGMVSNDENSLDCNAAAFGLLEQIVSWRLARGLLTVVDATNVQSEARKKLVDLATSYDVLTCAIVLDVSEATCQARNLLRPDRDFGPHVIRTQRRQLMSSIRGRMFDKERIKQVYFLKETEIDDAIIQRTPLFNDKRHETGPFDLIGDIHGCFDEAMDLLAQLGYGVEVSTVSSADPALLPAHQLSFKCSPHPQGRRVIFLGDLVDRGPKSPHVVALVKAMVEAGLAFCVPGNHDVKLVKKLNGRDVRMTHGLPETMEQLEAETPEFVAQIKKFLDGLTGHLVLDDGRLVVAHAGMKAEYQGRASSRVRQFGLYGETTGETDEYGLPVRYNWAQDYRGKAMVVYGHVPTHKIEWINNTLCIDTGCVFGGSLTALRYPEKETLSIPARKTYYEPVKPLAPPQKQDQEPVIKDDRDASLDIQDVAGKRVIEARLYGGKKITIREAHATAALEIMSRFAVDPRWLVYLPPTMSPCETSNLPDYLEHPSQAFEYFLKNGISRIICEKKHMGSRAIVVVARDVASATKHFGTTPQMGLGSIYTRTGRQFFNDDALQFTFVNHISQMLVASGLFDELSTDWLVLDCELLPWSAKAKELIANQFEGVAVAATAGTGGALQKLQDAGTRMLDDASRIELAKIRERFAQRYDASIKMAAAYKPYLWASSGMSGLKLAPFHFLASQGAVHFDKGHDWHLSMASKLVSAQRSHLDGPDLLIETDHLMLDLEIDGDAARGIAYWMDLCAQGHEGMVVKPMSFVEPVEGDEQPVQPALKVRAREYLRIIYGPEYLMPHNLDKLKMRRLNTKRNLALREFALGHEALCRFVEGQPLYRVHQCVFGILALESEPVDPRL